MQWRSSVHILGVRVTTESHQSEDARIMSLTRRVVQGQPVVVVGETEVGAAG